MEPTKENINDQERNELNRLLMECNKASKSALEMEIQLSAIPYDDKERWENLKKEIEKARETARTLSAEIDKILKSKGGQNNAI